MLREYLAELHVHTVLSPCSDLLMTPANILKIAQRRGIEILAVTDHNSAENIEVLFELAKGSGVYILPGMEVETKEEVHLVVLFDTLEQVLALQELVYRHLPLLENDENHFGPQLLTDLKDNFVDRVSRLLAVSISLSLDEVVAHVERLGGLVYPAHVDRQRNSILTQLGFIPSEPAFLALEVSNRYFERGEFNPLFKNYPLIPAADVHFIDSLQGSVIFKIESPKVAEIKKALLREDGRNYYWRGSK
ncbi:histidinol phosphatase [Anoxybacter fermentans]|uniref:Histidinol phosphatase n=1 Tax=Anoxybacter fermentans TaxID=1323375 RepID=A0A3S9SYI1_9FIRM|nr:PHP domain-containing protein [Anoxybacter fermentans]AZR73308.1 histidinol phosphatase [Anoxybacter fermentans]